MRSGLFWGLMEGLRLGPETVFLGLANAAAFSGLGFVPDGGDEDLAELRYAGGFCGVDLCGLAKGRLLCGFGCARTFVTSFSAVMASPK